MSPEEFAAKWSNEANAMRHLGALVNGAALLTDVLHDFDAVIRGQADELLTLTEAARESGYSADHLRLLIRQAKIPNAGRRRAPRVRRRDIPRKPGGGAPPGNGRYLPSASAEWVARSLVKGD
jgi:hypothetical protein